MPPDIIDVDLAHLVCEESEVFMEKRREVADPERPGEPQGRADDEDVVIDAGGLDPALPRSRCLPVSGFHALSRDGAPPGHGQGRVRRHGHAVDP